MRIAVVPARGGSRRIPRKNVRPFVGRPMIAWAIDVARDSGLFDAVVVSTDDDAIAAVARAHGAEVPFRRPAPLADDHAPTVPVIAHAIDALRALGRPVEHACCVYPCVPLLRPSDLVDGWHALRAGGGDGYAFPVVAFASPPQRALRRLPDGRVAPLDPTHADTRTQDLEPAFHDAGQYYWAHADTWLDGRSIHAHGRGVPMPAWRVIDIDTPDDWARAEAMHAALHGAPVA